jgi:hypothetical protein
MLPQALQQPGRPRPSLMLRNESIHLAPVGRLGWRQTWSRSSALAASCWQPSGANNAGRRSAVVYADEREPDDRDDADMRRSPRVAASSSSDRTSASIWRSTADCHDRITTSIRVGLRACPVDGARRAPWFRCVGYGGSSARGAGRPIERTRARSGRCPLSTQEQVGPESGVGA